YDRPFSFWAYFLIGRLGTAPLVWHTIGLLQRWLLVLALAWALKTLWPKHANKITFIALIFAIYPGYYVQPLSVIFAPHLAAYILFFISLGAMGRAITDPKRSRTFTLLALGTAVAQMFTLEYYVGLELIRPLYIWMMLRNQRLKTKSALAHTIRMWAPYSVILAAWFVWRLFLFNPPVEPYPLAFAANLDSVVHLLQVGVNDFASVILKAWVATLGSIFAKLDSSSILVLLIAVAAAGAIVAVLVALEGNSITRRDAPEKTFAQEALLLGIAAFFAGMFPIWVIGEAISKGDYSQRYILVAMFGAALIVVAAITWLIPSQRGRIILISVLAGVSIASHLYHTNEFQLDWQTQRNFYWQLYWRAPAIESGTALISFDRLTHWTGEPLLGNALNTLYSPSAAAPYVGLWNFELNRTKTVRAIENGEILINDYRGLLFTQSAAESLFVYYKPIDGCLWILTPIDANNEYLPLEIREIAAYSNTGVILPEATSSPDRKVFGAEPEHDWCYYFEKAELANQQGNWDETINLMDEAQYGGFQPVIGIEWLPLVRAYAMTDNWQAAQELSLRVHDMQTQNDTMLCALWAELPASEAAIEVNGIAGCNG
ncbi:MAG TPA: hypothetical protein VLK33_16715, partial [Terriglobales bacterium]|nr:hypothetical protein [Terriglobales bacterium]